MIGRSITTKLNGNGENVSTDIAVDNLGKLYYHHTRLGSTSFITDTNGVVRSYATYDEWGNVRVGGSHDINIASIDSTQASRRILMIRFWISISRNTECMMRRIGDLPRKIR